MDASSDFAFIFCAALFGLVVIPPLCATLVASWRRSGRSMDLPKALIWVAPLIAFSSAHVAGLSFVYSHDGVVVFVGTYAMYCLGSFGLAWTRGGLKSVVGWLLAIPIAGGLALGTIGIVGLAWRAHRRRGRRPAVARGAPRRACRARGATTDAASARVFHPA